MTLEPIAMWWLISDGARMASTDMGLCRIMAQGQMLHEKGGWEITESISVFLVN